MKHIGTKTLETPRLILRRFAAGDASAMFTGWCTDPEVTRYVRFNPHENLAVTQEILSEWVASYEKDDFYNWGIELKESGQLIGSIGIVPSAEAEAIGYWEPGYCLARAFWGQGYATEALRAVVDYFVHGTGQTELHTGHATANPASGRVMEKAGFRYDRDGVFHKFDGTPMPCRLYVYTAPTTEDNA